MSDIEGKAATGSGERGGSRPSFKHRFRRYEFNIGTIEVRDGKLILRSRTE